MDQNVIGYLGWCAVGGVCFVTAVSIWRSKKAVSLRWKKLDGEVTDVKKYNHAVAKLYILYGAVFILAGLPLFLLAFALLMAAMTHISFAKAKANLVAA